MKAVTSENSNAFSTGVYGSSGKISKHSSASHRKDVENEEIRVYLSKLKELVPFMPKNRKLSKLEVIQYVIDYIYDLQYALETHPTLNSAAVHSAAAAMLSAQSQPQVNTVSPVHRQPLGVLPPNANIQVTTNAASCVNSSCSSPESNTTSAVSNRTIVSEKVSSSPVTSCSSTESASTVLQC